MELILASTSPRRRELLAHLGLPFRVLDSGVVEERPDLVTPVELASQLAQEKAEAVAGQLETGVVIGSDTVVSLQQSALGKPAHPDQARQMLRRLRNREHEVITSIHLIDASSGRREWGLVRTQVRMGGYSNQEIDQYVNSGEPMDKAGAYAIQGLGRQLVAGFQGCFLAVVGFPLCLLIRLLALFDVFPTHSGPHCRLPSGQTCPNWLRGSIQADC